MIRTLTDKLTTAKDTLTWVRTQHLNEDIACLINVLETFVVDIERIGARQEVTEEHYNRLWTAQAISGVLVEELLEDHASELTGHILGDVPQNLPQLLLVVLEDALFQFTQVLLSVRRKRGRYFHPLSIAGAE